MLGITLRYPYEVRDEKDYFGDLPDEKIPKDMLDLAAHIVETKSGHFDPGKFEDHYEEALKDLLKKKQEGKPIERPERREPTKVVNLMDALRKSVEASCGTSAKARRSSSESSKETKPNALANPRKTAFNHPKYRPRSSTRSVRHSLRPQDFYGGFEFLQHRGRADGCGSHPETVETDCS